MTIIEVDSNEFEPEEVDLIPILAGQRYSMVITANHAVWNYWTRALLSVSNPTYDGGQNLAILRYGGAEDEHPTSTATYDISFDEGSLHPLTNPGALGTPGIGKADVNLQFFVGNNFSGHYAINVSYADRSCTSPDSQWGKRCVTTVA